MSVDSQGVQNNKNLLQPSVSNGGRYVAFFGATGVWVPGSAGLPRIWRKDMQTGELLLASTLLDGTPANGLCRAPDLSNDGSAVAFETVAANIPGYPGGSQQIAIKDFVSGACEIASLNGSGTAASNYCWAPRMEGDGRWVAFRSGATNMQGPPGHYSSYVRDRVLGTTLLISVSSTSQPGDAFSSTSSISISGGYAAFTSEATNLVPNDNAGHEDVFLRDLYGDSPHGYGSPVAQSTGCLPHLSWSGTPSLGAGSGFSIDLADVRTLQPGLLIYSRQGPTVLPFFGERLYVSAPIVRTAPQQAGGSSSGPCNGLFQFDFNSYLASGLDGALVAGTRVWAQYWSRDPMGSNGAWLSDALTFVIAP